MGKGRSESGRFRPNAYKGKKDSNVRRFGRAIGKFVQSNNDDGHHTMFTKKKSITRKEKRRLARLEKKARKTKGLESLQGNNVAEKKPKKLVKLVKEDVDGRDEKQQKLERRREKESADLQDDSAIKKYAILLGLNKRKNKKSIPASFVSEGLDYLLEVTDPDKSNTWSDDEDEEWLHAKRLKSERRPSGYHEAVTSSSSEASVGCEDNVEWQDCEDGSDGYLESGNSDDNSNADADISEALSDKHKRADRVPEAVSSDEENDGEAKDATRALGLLKQKRSSARKGNISTTSSKVGASTRTSVVSGSSYNSHDHVISKYVSPHLRGAFAQQNEKGLLKRKRHLKGLLNRLSEGNMASILCQIEQMYRENSRNDMNESLAVTIEESCISDVMLPSKFALEYMELIAGLSVRVGNEVGAFILQELVQKFHKLLQKDGDYGGGKEIDNTLQLISHLYNFKVTHCCLIYDIIRKLIGSFSEKDIELLLMLLKNVGMAIRKDDPSSLKDIILQIQQKSNAATMESPRMGFMLETINALRTNNPKKIPNYDPSLVERATKQLKFLLPSGSLSEARLKISYDDLVNTDKQGRWWIVGSAWTARTETSQDVRSTQSVDSWVLELARKQKMNTDVRKNVFAVIITSEDFNDAFEKLLKLNLKEVQEREIVHVLVDCCLREKVFNPYYVHLSQRLCEYKKANQVTFQYTLWDKLKSMNSLPKMSFANLWRLISHLIANRAVSLGVLRIIEFSNMDKVCMNFLSCLLRSLLCDYSEDVCRSIFMRIAPLPNLKGLREALILFMHHFLKDSDSLKGTQQAPVAVKLKKRTHEELLNMRIQIAADSLKTIL